MEFNNLLLAEKTFNEDLLEIISYIAIIFGGLVTLYALYLAYAMATASDAGRRAEAKKRVINSIAIVLILIALVGMLKIMDTKTTTVSATGYEMKISGSGTSYTLDFQLASGVANNATNNAELKKAKNAASFTVVSGEGWVIRGSAGGPWKLEYEGSGTPPSVSIKYTVGDITKTVQVS